MTPMFFNAHGLFTKFGNTEKKKNNLERFGRVAKFKKFFGKFFFPLY